MFRPFVVPLFLFPALCAAQFCAAPIEKQSNDFWSQRTHQDSLRTGMVYRQAAIEEYRSLLEKHKGEPEYVYLYGRVLVGTKTPEAIALFDQVLEKDARFAPAHLSLVEIYRAPNFRDNGKARDHLAAWMTLCPEGLEGFHFLERWETSDFLREQVVRMRTLLETRHDRDAMAYYRTLWRLEFQASPANQYPRVKEKVRADLARMAVSADAATLREGHQLLGDPVPPETITAVNTGAAAMKTYSEWQVAHPYPKPDGKGVFDQNALRERNKAQLEASAEWIKKFPNDPFAWSQRIHAIQMNRESTSDEDVEFAVAGLKRAKDSGNRATTPEFQIASLYLQRGMHLSELPEMIGNGLTELEHAPQPENLQSDLYPAPPWMNLAEQQLRNQGYGYELLTDAYLRADQPGRALEGMAKLRKILDGHTPADPLSESRYWDKMGQIAEKQGRKLEALVDYQAEIRISGAMQGMVDSAKRKAKVLWTDLGGTEAGWTTYVGKTEGAKPVQAVSVIKEWDTKDTVLPELEIEDLQGKTWRLTEIKGKTTLVNLWATWCAPCRQELPHLQKLYDKWKYRKDFQIVTLNTDDNPGLIEGFMRENHYTFPVLPARAYVDRLVPSLSIPRNWIVNRDGVLKMEAIGFGNLNEDDWMAGIETKMKDAK